MPRTAAKLAGQSLPKTPSGIRGLDEITNGGLPRGRPTLVCGTAGCGKTLMAIEFLVRGATDHGEPGVLVAFEETAPELTQNVRSLGFDLDELVRQKKLVVDFVRVERSEIEETGDYDLEGLFVRLGHAIDSVKAKRVVLDTIESLFSGLSNDAVLRAELRRLFRWLKARGVTAIITAERGDGAFTRQGLEEYVSDCVILLDHRIIEQVSTRRLRIVKYRGTTHGTNEYPFLIDEDGISVLPITSLGLRHDASSERVASGVPQLDAMLGGKGYYRGSTIAVSGTAGSGKSSLAAHFVDAACRRGERCLYFAFEESPGQIVRNMRSIGIDLEQWVKKGLLRFQAIRSTMQGLEMHLASFHKLVQDFAPRIVILDPVGSLNQAGSPREATAMLMRLIDALKMRSITAMLTTLTSSDTASTDVDVSSLVDTWLLLRNIEVNGERNRVLYVLKSRGMAHSNQVREFLLTDEGIRLVEVYLGPDGVLTGSARLCQEARQRAADGSRSEETAARKRGLERKRRAMEARIEALRREFEIEVDEAAKVTEEREARERATLQNRIRMGLSRQSDNGEAPAARPARGPARGGRR